MFINFIRLLILICFSLFDSITIYNILRKRSYCHGYKKIFSNNTSKEDLDRIFNKDVAPRFLYNSLFNMCIRLGGLYFSGNFYNIILRLTYFIDSICYIVISQKHRDVINLENLYIAIIPLFFVACIM